MSIDKIDWSVDKLGDAMIIIKHKLESVILSSVIVIYAYIDLRLVDKQH